MTTQYCLRWNNHQPNFVSVFSTLLKSEALVDVTLSADGKHLQAHKLVLSACSTYFQSLFAINPCQHPIVILKDVKFTHLKVIVDFMYSGEVNVFQDELASVLKTAEALKIKGLAEIPEFTLKDKDANSSVEQTEVLTNDESSQPISPTSKRKKIRKSMDGNAIEAQNEDVSIGLTLIKPDPGTPSHNESHQVSQESIKSDISQQLDVLAQDVSQPVQSMDNEMAGPSITTQTVTGYQWGIVDQHYPHFTQATLTLPQELHYTTAQLPQAYVGGSVACTSTATAAQQQHVATATSPPIEPPPTEPAGTPPKRKRNPQAQDNFLRALEAVRFGGIGFCKAARLYGVNSRTLWIEYKKRGYSVSRVSIKQRKADTVAAAAAAAAAAAEEASAHAHSQTSDGAEEPKHAQHLQQQPEAHQQTLTHALEENAVAFIDGRPVEIATPMIQRSRYFDSGLMHTTPINIQSINYDQIEIMQSPRI